MARSRLILIGSIVVLAGGCDGFGSEVCTSELRTRFSPADTTIQVGQSFRASVRLSTCGGKQQVSDVFTWRTDDSAVATVEGATGRVMGRGAGTTRILASGARYGPVGSLQVSIQAGP